MFYGVSQSTDQRCKNTIIKKFTTENALKKWLSNGSGEYTYKDPVSANNFHHTFKYGYELYGRIRKKDPIFQDHGSSFYPRTELDNIVYYLEKYGTRID